MKIPVVLPTVQVEVTENGELRVDVDGEPRDAERVLGRGDLRSVLDDITVALDSAVRVEVEEADGTTYADIATPPEPEGHPTAEPTAVVATPGISGTGFQPGEEIAIAYVVARQTADEDGTTTLRLPPTLLAAKREGLVLLGMSSCVIASLH